MASALRTSLTIGEQAKGGSVSRTVALSGAAASRGSSGPKSANHPINRCPIRPESPPVTVTNTYDARPADTLSTELNVNMQSSSAAADSRRAPSGKAIDCAVTSVDGKVDGVAAAEYTGP